MHRLCGIEAGQPQLPFIIDQEMFRAEIAVNETDHCQAAEPVNHLSSQPNGHFRRECLSKCEDLIQRLSGKPFEKL